MSLTSVYATTVNSVENSPFVSIGDFPWVDIIGGHFVILLCLLMMKYVASSLVA